MDSVLIFKDVNLVHSRSLNELEFLFNKSLAIDQKTGVILEIKDCFNDLSYEGNVRTLKENELIIPGFIDTHAHAPQHSYKGTGLDLPLLKWLEKYTFPCESKFKDLEFAEKIYRKSVSSHINNGSTTVSFYATIHLEATKVLADIVEEKGLRGYIGKVCMDRNSPNWYLESSTSESIENTEKFIQYVLPKNKSTLVPIVTPRFAPTSTPELLKSLGSLATKYKIPMQTHLCENVDEIKWVKELFPECKSYTDVYKKYDILREDCILAHCVYLDEDELNIIKESNAGISHCPNSNTSLQSGIMPARRYLDHNIKLGLGTDVAGGFSSSMLDAIRGCIGCSKIFKAVIDSGSKPLSLAESFYIATLGGADLLNLKSKIGNFEIGKEFDALIISFDSIDHEPANETLEEIFEKFIYLGDDRNIREVFVKGRQIKS